MKRRPEAIDLDPATIARADRATAREHCRPDSLFADPELHGDLSKREAIGVEPGSVLTDRVRQLRLACCQSRLPGYLPAPCRGAR